VSGPRGRRREAFLLHRIPYQLAFLIGASPQRPELTPAGCG
jgi:hypothetical protein